MSQRGLASLAQRAWRAIGERAGWADAWLRGESVPSSSRFSDPYRGVGGAMQVAALSACVRLISGNTARPGCHAYRLQGENRERERKHPVDHLLNVAPNDWQDAFEFRRQMTANVALYGNAYALKDGSGRYPDRLVPLDPTRMSVRQDDDFTAPTYEYRPKRGATRPYLRSDILHLRDLTLDGITGLSRIEQARQGISLAMAAETYAYAFFANGAESGVALKTDKNLTPDQRKQLLENWTAAHQGVQRSHVPTVLEGGLALERTSTTNKDSQFLELRSFQVEDIARLYGVPAHLIGLTEKQTSWGTGVEQQSLGFMEFHLLDWFVMWEQAIRRDLIADPGVFVEHVVDDRYRADIKTRMDAYAVAIQNGIFSRNECRKKENAAPYDEGNEFLYPANMTLASSPVAAADDERPTLPSQRPDVAWRVAMRRAERAITERQAA